MNRVHVSSVIKEGRIQSVFPFQQKEDLYKLRSQQKSFENLTLKQNKKTYKRQLKNWNM